MPTTLEPDREVRHEHFREREHVLVHGERGRSRGQAILLALLVAIAAVVAAMLTLAIVTV